MAMSTSQADGEVIVDINTTPLIDVMLVLLTLLILTLPIQTHAVKLDMPRPNQAPPPENTESNIVELGVDFDATTPGNAERVDRDTMDSKLLEAAKMNPAAEIQLDPNRLAKYDA